VSHQHPAQSSWVPLNSYSFIFKNCS
jgi:hypothetical protein